MMHGPADLSDRHERYSWWSGEPWPIDQRLQHHAESAAGVDEAEPVRTIASCAAKIAASACTLFAVSLPFSISALSAPTHPSGDSRGATTAPLDPGRLRTT